MAMVAALSMITGCAWRNAGDENLKAPAAPPNPYATIDLGELMRYAGKLAGSTPEERLAETRKLLEIFRSDRGLGLRLHLLLAQSAAGPAEQLHDAINLIDLVLPEVGDEGLKSFLIYQKAILVRLEGETDRRNSLAREANKIRVKEQQAHRRLKSQESELKSQESELKSQETELKAVQRKLEDLKAIEPSLEPKSEH